MAPSFQDIVEQARLSARALKDYGDHFFNPTVRLGVTGLSRAGKTVFITALIHGLTRGGRFPIFEPFATGRIARARLEPQPDDAVPRFTYENHARTLIEQRSWPNSTVDISELRLVIDYQRQNGADRVLTLDIVDYPGEWLLDLPLLNKSFEQWSAESLRPIPGAVARPARGGVARPSRHVEPARPRRRTGRAGGGAAVHRLFARLPRRTFCDEPAAARPLSDARQPRRFAGADLCAARRPHRQCSTRGFAVGDDGAALRGVQGRGGPPVLPRSFLAARSPNRPGRCALGVQCRTGSAGRSRGGAGGNSGLFQNRAQHVSQRPVPAADRPHPVCRDQGRSSAPFQP